MEGVYHRATERKWYEAQKFNEQIIILVLPTAYRLHVVELNMLLNLVDLGFKNRQT